MPAVFHPRTRVVAGFGWVLRAAPRIRAVPRWAGHRPRMPRRARAGRRAGRTRPAQVAQRCVRRLALFVVLGQREEKSRWCASQHELCGR